MDKWPKDKGIYTDITSICEALEQPIDQCDHDSVSISYTKMIDKTCTEDLNALDCSFMYTQILKEILLTIDFDQEHIGKFLGDCRKQFASNTTELRSIDKIQKEYHHQRPIWWYTFKSFLHSMLNTTLRLMKIDHIVSMGFFVKDLHNDITTLHYKQYREQKLSNSFTVYRGQGLSRTDFAKLRSAQGGLLAFNNFLSTSRNRDTSLRFARRSLSTLDLIGILFVLKIDPSISGTPFANVKDVSCYPKEEEILFSMHSVFRIGEVEPLDESKRLWCVNLTFTDDTDPYLKSFG